MKQRHTKVTRSNPTKQPRARARPDSPQYLGLTASEWSQSLLCSDGLQRRLAVYALGELGPAAKEAVPALQRALQDPESYVRVWAAAALNKVDPHCTECLDVLIACLHDPLYFVRSLAAWHVGRNCPDLPRLEKCLPALESLLDDDNPSVRSEAAISLKKIEGKIGSPPELQVMSDNPSAPNER